MTTATFVPACITNHNTIIVAGIVHVLDMETQDRMIVRVLENGVVRVEKIQTLGKTEMTIAQAKKLGLLPE